MSAQSPIAALAAYRNAAQRITAPAAPAVNLAAEAPNGFAHVMTRALQAAVDAGRDADRRSVASINGEGSVTELALAVSKAELALQATVAVRDRLVAAYQDVMRMSI